MSWEEVVDPASSAGFIIRLTPVETDTAENRLLHTNTYTHMRTHYSEAHAAGERR